MYADRDFSDIYGIQDHLANKIKAGETITNSNGEEMVKILKVDIKPAKRTVISSSGTPYVVSDPLLKDVFLELEVNTKEVNNKEFMFFDLPFLVGSTVPINLKHISFWPTITEIIR
jgi:hypothetical protein